MFDQNRSVKRVRGNFPNMDPSCATILFWDAEDFPSHWDAFYFSPFSLFGSSAKRDDT
jgi:hypothetical protein